MNERPNSDAQAKDHTQLQPERSGWAAVSPVSVTFRDTDLELRFQRFIAADEAAYLRFTFFAAIFLWALFGVLDWFTLGEDRGAALTIRFAVSFPLGMVFFLLASIKENYRRVQLFTFGICSIAGGSIGAMTLFIDGPARLYYVMGIMVVHMAVGFLFQTQIIVTVLTLGAINLFYALSTWMIAPLDRTDTITAAFFMIGSSLFVLQARYRQEMQARRSYARKILLQEYTDKIVDLLRESKAAEEAKKSFLSVISHELRTPLNSIIGFSDIIMNETLGKIQSPQYVQFASSINDAGRSLLKIVNDIIHYTRAESGKLELNLSHVSLPTFLADSVGLSRARASERNLKFDVRIASGLENVELWIDARLIQHAIAHLLENAINFSPDGGAIQLRSETNERGLVIIVSDTGPGISEELRERVFNPFAQDEGTLTRSTEGVGIGLPFSKKIAELHGGDVMIGSSESGGAEITLQLPNERFRVVDRRDAVRA